MRPPLHGKTGTCSVARHVPRLTARRSDPGRRGLAARVLRFRCCRRLGPPDVGRRSEGVRHAGQVQPGRRPEDRAGQGAQRARPQPGHLCQRRVLCAVGTRDRGSGAGLAGVGGRAAREPARGSQRAGSREGRHGHVAGRVQLLPGLAQGPVHRDPLPADRRRRGGLRQAVGDEDRGRGPAPRGAARREARWKGRRRRPLAGRDDHHRLRHLGLPRKGGRRRARRLGLHRRWQRPGPGHEGSGDQEPRRPERGLTVAAVRRHRVAVRGPVQLHRSGQRAPGSPPARRSRRPPVCSPPALRRPCR